MLLPLSLLASFAFSFAAPFLFRANRLFAVGISVLLPLGLFALFTSHFDLVINHKAFEFNYPWVPTMGLDLSFYLDGLSLLFIFLITGMGALVSLFSYGYMKNHARLGEFYAYLFLFMGSMLGVVLSNHLILLFVFWELTSLSSFLLIGFEHEKPEARKASMQAFLVTGAGGLALLAGLILLAQIGGTYHIQELIAQSEKILAHPWCNPALFLVLIGALTKSAQMPFHFWLPNAMAAPTPVSAYLHSATMVKAGVFLVARLSPAFAGTLLWQGVLIPIGILTSVGGAMFALKQTDLKKLLAYSTVSTLGMLMTLLGLGTEEAIGAATVYLLVHSLYKGALFMVAGVVDHQTGSRDIMALNGLSHAMPVTAAAAVLAALSMAGFPPLFGFIGKELLYFAKVDSPDAGWILYLMSLVSNMIVVAVAFIVGFEPFSGRQVVSPKEPKEAGFALLAGPALLACLGAWIGLKRGGWTEPLLSAAASNISGNAQEIVFKFWHGFNMVFVFSVITLAGGLVIFYFRNSVRSWIEKLPPLAKYGPEESYNRTIRVMMIVAKAQTRFLQSGYLSRYIFLTLSFTIFLLSLLFLLDPPTDLFQESFHLPGEIAALLGLVAAAAITISFTKSRILSAASLGVIGFGLAVFYAVYSAPDLAITQMIVETLSVVLVVFLMARVKNVQGTHSGSFQILKVATAGMIGFLAFILAQLSIKEQMGRESISQFFAENSYLLAKGKNVVNVILVDFRALDTLGEISVLCMAALGVLTLLKRRTS